MNQAYPWTLAGLVLAVASPAQSWEIPPRGVAFYQRTTKLTGTLPGLRHRVIPPILLAGELDSKQRFVERPPSHLQDLAMWVAFDLRQCRKGGRLRKTVPFLEPYGALRLEGTVRAPDDTGKQTLEVKVTRREPERGATPKRVFESYHLRHATTELVGTLEIERTFDAGSGTIRSFSSKFYGTTTPIGDGKAAPAAAEFAYYEEWKLDRIAANRYPGFTTKVKTAIERGSERIRKRIENPDAKPFDDTENDGRTTNTGRLALALLTLLKADVAPKDPVLERGFDSLRRRNVLGAYECSTALMAMEALYAPVNERENLIEGRIDKPMVRKPSPEDRKLMEEWTEKVLSYTDSRIRNTAYERRFNYVAGNQRYDNSVTQYCVLGLYSAHLCGIPISPTVWFGIAKHVLDDQRDGDGKALTLRLVSQKDYRKMRKQAAEATPGRRGTGTVSGGRRVEPRGWAYQNPVTGNTAPNRPLTGSMTVAGITNLTICESVLRAAKKGGEVLRSSQKASRQGFAWLLQNFTVRTNPEYNHHDLYYLYGLERAAELARVALLGDRDWYFEGATMLIEMQAQNGSFGGDVDTCFAVLFLKQAAPPLPVFSGR